MSKQASLFSFFKDTGSTPKTSTPARDTKKICTVVDGTPKRGSPLTRRGNRDESSSPVKPAAKKRRVIVSSDEEYEDENEKQAKTAPQTPKTPKSSAVSRVKNNGTPKVTPKVSTDMAESFISSFRFDETMDASMSEKTANTTIPDNKITVVKEEDEQFTHESLEWLKPDKIRDANKRLMSDPEYDSSTLFVPPNFLNDQTPGHKQWWTIKAANFDTVLLFKVGKFYELYHMDAVVSVNCLSLAYMRGNYAHSGFPEAAYGKFADQLVARGYKVARVEQTETPQQLEERNKKNGGSKEKVVKRELCRITTSATKTYGILDGESNINDVESGTKYLLAVKEMVINGKSAYGVCFIDTAIGQFNICQFEDDDYRSFLRTVIAKFAPAQVLVERGHISRQTASILNSMLVSVPQEALTPKKQFLTADDTVAKMAKSKYLGTDLSTWPSQLSAMLDASSVVPKPSPLFSLAWSSLGAVVSYLERCLIDVDMVTMKNFVTFSSSLITTKADEIYTKEIWKKRSLVIDGVTIANLNLLPSSDVQASSVSLYSIVNTCNTSFGCRMLRQWICSPSCDLDVISARQTAVEFLSSSTSTFTKSLTIVLKELPDLERLMQKIHTCGLKYRAECHPDSRAVMFEAATYNKRKIKNLALALDGFTACVKVFRIYHGNVAECPTRSPLLDDLLSSDCAETLSEMLEHFQDSVDLKKALESGRIEPKPGNDTDYDRCVDRVKECLNDLEKYKKDQEQLLKCSIFYSGTGRNRYQMEIPESKNLSSKYEIKGKRKGYGRFQTPELVALIEDLTEAEQQQENQANESARKVFEKFDQRRCLWSSVVERLATLDVLMSLAKYSQTCTMETCRPEFVLSSEKPMLAIENGSHPCLAAQVTPSCSNAFIANDTILGGDQPATMLLTGPNMGGKSTLMRQVAVLVVMAHMGALVPARSMKLSPVDRIFTRIGANDKIMCGESTFFVEMKETQVILRDATIHSLVLVDELGRGTSTFDGTAIASAVMDYFASHIRCRTFFSTHYHSLCTNAKTNRNILQAHMACMVENENDEDPTDENVTFLYKLTAGACPKSYGFFAAKLAGIRDEVVRHAFTSSARIMKTTDLDCATRQRLRDAAIGGTSVEELEQMVAAL